MKKLTIYYCGWGERWPLATLAENGKSLLFEYTEEATQNAETTGRRLRGFSGASDALARPCGRFLPGWMGLVAHGPCLPQRGAQVCIALDRLAFIGERAMGALSYEPAEAEYPIRKVRQQEVAAAVAANLARLG